MVEYVREFLGSMMGWALLILIVGTIARTFWVHALNGEAE